MPEHFRLKSISLVRPRRKNNVKFTSWAYYKKVDIGKWI